MSCPDCFLGEVSKGQPTGKELEIHGVQTYVTGPEAGVSPKGIIVYITDAFGYDFVNNRVLCDQYAKRGFLVYCPDFMNGRSMSPSIIAPMHTILEKKSWLYTIFVKPFILVKVLYHLIPWFMTCSIAKTEAGVIKYFTALRTSPPPFQTRDLKIGAAGFCWGGKHTVTLAQDYPDHRVTRHSSQSTSSAPEPLIDAAFLVHPTFIKVPEDIDAIKIPISWSVGEEDLQMKTDDIKKMKAILESKQDAEHEVILIPGAKHGYAVRTDPEDKVQMAAAEQAEQQAVSWFSRRFTRTPRTDASPVVQRPAQDHSASLSSES
ncbi:alpha/beta-hydrolase [Pseudovirgaria hyperparasitica]|uniref:Alpha/beta-hydrolase n=1 Tax=Pseudovirgaria hyperparasitica TaxID=470096 RepID=A0A6A6WLM0_9PEZI|nr:alpha/beta-hydrolase [Pseudovirgaria hyperparasitica]KAF2763048.1 alpha/beta-hydrolase [Pseudovirgaria hyperparasitica]